MKRILIISIFILVCLSAFGQGRYPFSSIALPAPDPEPTNPYAEGTVEHVNYELGVGLNTYLIAGDDWKLDWTDDKFTQSANRGFDHFRGVMQKSNTDYSIDATLINNLREIIDSTLAAGMRFVFDYHIAPPWWSTWTEAEKDSLASHWAQFTRQLSDYHRDSVIFDIVNEPGGSDQNVSVSDWNSVTAEVVDSIRVNDADRIVMVSPLEWGHVEGLEGFTIPSDTSLILTIHFYEPNWVTKQNFWNGEDTVYQNSDWPKIKPLYDDLDRRFDPLDTFLLTNDIPVNIGEFGTNIFADTANREHYSLMMRTLARDNNWSITKWNFGYDYGIYNDSSLVDGGVRWLDYLVDALINDTLQYVSYDSTAIHDYSSGFTAGDENNFSTYTTGSGAIDALSVNGSGELVCNVTGTDYNHLNVRLYLPDMDLKKNSIYRITFNWRSSNQKEEMALKASGNHTWNYYYDLNTTSTTTVFTLVFPKNTQLSSKYELLLGYGTGTIYIESLLIEELTVP